MFNIPSAVPLPTMRPDLYQSGGNGLPASASPGAIMQGSDGQNYQFAETAGMMRPDGSPAGNQGWIRTSMTPGTARAPGMMNRLRDNSDLLLAIGAGLLGGQTGPEQWAGGIGGASQALQGRKAQKEKNRTLEFLRQSYPEVAQMVDAGMPIDQAFKMVQDQRQAMMPDYSFQKLDDGTYGAFDANSGQFNAMGQAQVPQGFRQASPEEAASYGAQGGQFGPDGKFYPLNPPSGMTFESDGQGGFRMTQGVGTKFTEAQSKDNVYSTRARGALPTIDQYEQSLTGIGDRFLDLDPTGQIRGRAQSTEYQLAQAAGREFLQAILRKDTGAAITPAEEALYGQTYLPQPGDGPEVIAYKRQARLRAAEAIEAGMSPAQIVARERALQASGGTEPIPSQSPQRYRFNPETGELE